MKIIKMKKKKEEFFGRQFVYFDRKSKKVACKVYLKKIYSVTVHMEV